MEKPIESEIDGSLSLSKAIAIVDTPEGRARFRDYLASEPFPHFEAHPEDQTLLVRIEEDGTRTTGRFINRDFCSDSEEIENTKKDCR